MSDPLRADFPTDFQFTEALRSLPVDPASPGFDDAVLAALRVPAPWWQRLTWREVWQPVRPLLLGTSCSLGLTLLLLHLTLTGPQTLPTPLPTVPSNLAAAPSALLPSVDALLDRPGLRAGSLAAWNISSLPVDPGAAGTGSAGQEKADPRPPPRRRASVSRPSLIA